MSYIKELRTEISLLMKAAHLGEPYDRLYRTKERWRQQLDLALAPRQKFTTTEQRTEALLDALTNCTVFSQYQTNYENGEFTNWVGDMHEHARFLYQLATKIKAKNILEFGIGSGQSTLYLAAAAADNGGKAISVDPRPKHEQFVRKNLKYWNLDHASDLKYGYDSFTFRKLYHEQYADAPLDFTLIDSGHTYATTKQEIAMWLPLLRQGGVMIFHDIVWCFDAVQYAVDEFLRDKKAVYIQSDGWLKSQCDRCTSMGDLRPQINQAGRPTAQSAEVFDTPALASQRSFSDYKLTPITHEAAAQQGADYSYEMRTNSCGIGVLMKHTPYQARYNPADTTFASNWNDTPITAGPTI